MVAWLASCGGHSISFFSIVAVQVRDQVSVWDVQAAAARRLPARTARLLAHIWESMGDRASARHISCEGGPQLGIVPVLSRRLVAPRTPSTIGCLPFGEACESCTSLYLLSPYHLTGALQLYGQVEEYMEQGHKRHRWVAGESVSTRIGSPPEEGALLCDGLLV